MVFVDPGYFPYVFLFLGFAMAAILLGLSIFSFAAPEIFAKWLSPYHWLSRRLFREKPGRWDIRIAYFIGMICLISLILIQFFLGGMVITMAFRLWQSPFAFLL